MRKQFAYLFASSLILTGCTSSTTTETTETSTPETTNTTETGMTAGTYEASFMGMKGDLTVSVTVDESSIVNVEVTNHMDTPVISDAAINQIPAQIVETQNIQVDNVTGATMTSLAIKNAVGKAIEQAGGNTSDFKKATEEITKTQQDSESFDVVIVGSGMAGLSAAVQIARTSDKSVVVLEKNAYTGGSARVCGGGIWAVNSPLNEEIGQDSTFDEYVEFMSTNSNNDNLDTALMENIYNTSADVITYYYENGLPISLETWSLGNPNAQLPVFWAENGSETEWETGDSGFMDAIQEMVEELGVEIRLNSEATELLTDGNAVTGVKVESDTATYEINAENVILATGGFTRNAEYIEEYAPEYTNAFAFTGSGSTGDGITLTKDLDTVIVGEGMMGLYGLNANYGYYGSLGSLVWLPTVYVNAEGETFGMDSTFYGDTLKLLLDQTGSVGYGIFDSTTGVTDRLDDAVEAGVAYRYDSLEELADDRGIDKEALLKTAEERELAEGPYYCITARPLFIGSIPGLDIDEEAHVLNSNGEIIEGLLACGELTFGNVFTRAYPSSGTGIATSAYTGAIAGKTVVNQ